MSNIPIYTIGYGNRSIDVFLALLKQYGIRYLVDIRSQPYSRFNTNFSKAALELLLKRHQIAYMFMGDTLGGRPDDRSCYVNDKVEYALVREKPFFQQGIARVQTAWEMQLPIALMCSELKPEECHRSKLIGATLAERHITVSHIDENGQIKTQVEVLDIVTGNQPSLFPDVPHKKASSSRKKYSERDTEQDDAGQ